VQGNRKVVPAIPFNRAEQLKGFFKVVASALQIDDTLTSNPGQ
jgi:hypothetical protein